MSHGRMRSSVVIAKLLKSEGFSDHVAGIVERYWTKNILGPADRKKQRKFDKEIAEMCKKLTDAERLILGKFISTHKAMSFDAGLRIGLTAFARKGDKEYVMVEEKTAAVATVPVVGGTTQTTTNGPCYDPQAAAPAKETQND